MKCPKCGKGEIRVVDFVGVLVPDPDFGSKYIGYPMLCDKCGTFFSFGDVWDTSRPLVEEPEETNGFWEECRNLNPDIDKEKFLKEEIVTCTPTLDEFKKQNQED